MSKNGLLTYTAKNVTYSFPLWVMTLEQNNTLSGSTSQTRLARQFYARSFAPGNLAVGGRVGSQEEYQKLALFIRLHHRALLDVSLNTNYSVPGSEANNRLLTLMIPGEQILYKGIIDSFAIAKKGVFDPAPEYRFEFVILQDTQQTKIIPSYQVQRWYPTTALAPNAAQTPPDAAPAVDSSASDNINQSPITTSPWIAANNPFVTPSWNQIITGH